MDIVTTADIEKVVTGLGDLGDSMVFVGGSIVSFYADDPGAGEARPTEDIDMTLSSTGSYSWDLIQEELIELGFNPNPGRSICSYTFEGIEVDIMPSTAGSPGPVNSWYEPGFDTKVFVRVGNVSISLLSAPYFLASKFEAFQDRGADPRLSDDLEDIVYVLDNRINLVDEITKTDDEVKNFIVESLRNFQNHPNWEEIISAHLETEERFPMIAKKIEQITSLLNIE